MLFLTYLYEYSTNQHQTYPKFGGDNFSTVLYKKVYLLTITTVINGNENMTKQLVLHFNFKSKTVPWTEFLVLQHDSQAKETSNSTFWLYFGDT